ncbi:hypothetical protein V495_02883 [Pseudogymnoascus sp. VKM F-4514 (FW-929)]|nr:hypothetical protein V495_02883 [Pseudogymnoascus sp. VKM F-4514 (FW-929)]KFY62052.1 hypothetical protein V497_02591 [Pseudogymnoascus sp. VKM F-4516 (FW-969)]
MHLKSLLLAGFMATAAVASIAADTENLKPICGSTDSVNGQRDMVNAIPQNPSNIGTKAATLNVYVHVVSVDNTPAGGNVPDGQIIAQVNVLNQAFSRYGINFRLVQIDRTINRAWSDDANPQEQQQMKTTLRKGSVADLNIYILTKLYGAPPGYVLTGLATFPWDYQNKPWDDGISILYTTLPGGSTPGIDRGINAVHEVGHWVGLYHPFQGGCAAPGDYVDDTPPQESPSFGCPAGRDSCPQPGIDSIHNYMDYTQDTCRTEFTPGQLARLGQALRQFRGINL